MNPRNSSNSAWKIPEEECYKSVYINAEADEIPVVTNNVPLNDMCPTRICRTENKLKFLFPVIGSIPCTERKCIFRTVQGAWYRKKHSILRYLEAVHKFKFANKNIEHWCIVCQSPIRNNKVVIDKCMQDLKEQCGYELNHITLTAAEREDMPFK